MLHLFCWGYCNTIYFYRSIYPIKNVVVMYKVMYNSKGEAEKVSDLVRKQLYITRSQENLLKKRAKEMGLTEAEIVREAIDKAAYRVEYPRSSAEKWQKEISFINKRIASSQIDQKKRTWKREDLYDR